MREHPVMQSSTNKIKLLGARDLMEMLRISLRTLDAMVKKRELPLHAKIGGVRKWKESEVIEWIEQKFNRVGNAETADNQSTETGGSND